MAEVVRGTEDEPGALSYAARADMLAEEAFGERTFRRAGLVAALAIIAVLILALVLKIREIESRPGSGCSRIWRAS